MGAVALVLLDAADHVVAVERDPAEDNVVVLSADQAYRKSPSLLSSNGLKRPFI